MTSLSIKNIFVVAVVVMLFGCGSTKSVHEDDQWADEWATSPTHSQIQEKQREIDQLQRENANLMQEINRLLQDHRELSARIAELEKELLGDRVRDVRPADPTMTPERFTREYNRALNLFMNRRYTEAKDAFESLLETGIEHSLLANCQYWKGEALFGLGRYRDAIEEFRKVFNYTEQIKHDDAQVMIANSYYMIGDRERARQEYQRLIDRYPNSDFVTFAQQRLRGL